jgi:hypothetical protein
MINKITSLLLLTTLFLFSEDNATCVSTDPDAIALGLCDMQYHFLMGLTANFLGFTMVFLVGFLFVLQGRR